MEEHVHVELFTDGACSGNPGPGGWAYILRDVATGGEQAVYGGEPGTTNNRMELLAVIEGLKALKKPARVDVYSDSQYVILGLRDWLDGWIKKNWRRTGNKPVLNADLWKALDDLRQTHDLNCIWVRGHNNHPENERADALAVQGVEEYGRGR